MNYSDEKIIECAEFEELLTDYLDKTLEKSAHKSVAAHALKCPMCHSLLNDVKNSLEVCHEIAVPKQPLTRLEAKILAATTPDASMACREFEEHLTDYLDGFLPAAVFHRWERHAVMCENCTDLPGEVVRSIAACYTYKTEELPMPAGLHDRILQATIGTNKAADLKASWISQLGEWARGLRLPVPQLAPIALLLLMAFLFFSESASTGNSFGTVYRKSFELAGQTYQQGANVVLGNGEIIEPAQPQNQEPVQGVYVEDNKR